MSLADEFVRDRETAYRSYRDGDYDTALRLFRALEAYIATTPNQIREQYSQEWRDIKSVIDRLQRLVAGNQGISARPIEYRNPRYCTR